MIRSATRDDIPAIKRLSRFLFADEAELQPLFIRQAEHEEEFLLANIESDAADILLAEADGRAVGVAVVLEKDTPPYSCLVPYRYAYLMDLVVAPDFRDRGIGTKLLAAVKAWAVRRDLAYVELNVLEENVRGIRLYERAGYRGAMRTMRAWLKDDAAHD